MVKIPSFNTQDNISLGKRGGSDLNPVGSSISNPFSGAIKAASDFGGIVIEAANLLKRENDEIDLSAAKNERSRFAEKTKVELKEKYKGRDSSDFIPEYNKIMAEYDSGMKGDLRTREKFGIETKLSSSVFKAYDVFADGQNTSYFSQGVNYVSSEISEAKRKEQNSFIGTNAELISNSGLNLATVDESLKNIYATTLERNQGVSPEVAMQEFKAIAGDTVKTMLLNNIPVQNNNVISTLSNEDWAPFVNMMSAEQKAEVIASAKEQSVLNYTKDLANAQSYEAAFKDVSTALEQNPLFSASEIPETKANILKNAKEKSLAIANSQYKFRTEQNNAAYFQLYKELETDGNTQQILTEMSKTEQGRFLANNVLSLRERENAVAEEKRKGIYKEPSEKAAVVIAYNNKDAELFLNGFWQSENPDVEYMFESSAYQKASYEKQREMQEEAFKCIMYKKAAEDLKKNGVDSEKEIENAIKNLTKGNGVSDINYVKSTAKSLLANEINSFITRPLDSIKSAVSSAVNNELILMRDNKNYNNLLEIVSEAQIEASKKNSTETFAEKVMKNLEDEYNDATARAIAPYVLSGQYMKALKFIENSKM